MVTLTPPRLLVMLTPPKLMVMLTPPRHMVMLTPPRQDDPLPDGWEMRVHADGRVFYVDHATKSTQWEDPRKTKISSGPAIQYSRDYKVKYENFKANLPKPTVSVFLMYCLLIICSTAISTF